MAFQFGQFDGQSCSEAKLIALLRTRIFFGKQQAGFPTTRQGSNDATSIIDDVNHQIGGSPGTFFLTNPVHLAGSSVEGDGPGWAETIGGL